jgi:sugar O-acyltransferase (sialic acid O-acetyltransferase NeuD family)
MPRDLLIIGTSGLAREMAQLARRIDPDLQRWGRIRYVAASAELKGQPLLHGGIDLCDAELAGLAEDCDVVLGIGHPRARLQAARRLASVAHLHFPNLIHPRLEIDDALVGLGRGNVLTQGVVMTCDIRIGDFNLFNWNVTVGHDARIGSGNVINPGCSVSGHVQVADACLLGTGCQVLEGRRIASRTRLGAGAVLTRDILDEGSTWTGVPARPVPATAA